MEAEVGCLRGLTFVLEHRLLRISYEGLLDLQRTYWDPGILWRLVLDP
jgi:hypothetical protein